MSSHVDPERKQFEAFKSLPRDEPVMMLNLLRFRDRANYRDGRDVSGAEAYAAYGRDSAPVFRRVGGEIIWRGKPEVTLIEAVRHRQAAVLDSRLVRTTEAAAGQGFAIPQ